MSHDNDPGGARARALASYRRIGPLRSRLLSLSKALAVAAVWIVVALLFATLAGLNHGTGTRTAGSEEPAVARVGDCLRKGPISDDGFGFSWECRVTVTAADGRVVQTVVDHSMVTSPCPTGCDGQ